MLDLSSPKLTRQLRIARLENQMLNIQDAMRALKECYRLVSRMLEIERGPEPEPKEEEGNE